MVDFVNGNPAFSGDQENNGMAIAAGINNPAPVSQQTQYQYQYMPILPPNFNYNPSAQWQQQLAKFRQAPSQFQGLLSGFNPQPTQQQSAPIYQGFNAPTPNSAALSAQYLGQGK